VHARRRRTGAREGRMTMGAPERPVTVTESEARKVAFGAFVGTALEWYDFFLFGTAASLVFNRLYFASDD
jgi:hypothetical protein